MKSIFAKDFDSFAFAFSFFIEKLWISKSVYCTDKTPSKFICPSPPPKKKEKSKTTQINVFHQSIGDFKACVILANLKDLHYKRKQHNYHTTKGQYKTSWKHLIFVRFNCLNLVNYIEIKSQFYAFMHSSVTLQFNKEYGNSGAPISSSQKKNKN